MKKLILINTLMLILFYGLNLSSLFGEEVSEEMIEARRWEYYAVYKYPDLNEIKEYKDLFKSFGDISYLHTYFSSSNYPKRYEAYKEFLIRVFEDAKKGDVGEAMFANVAIAVTPVRIIIEMISPEIGAGGRLEGILEGPNNDIAKYIQRQNQQGFAGDPNFDHYVYFLKGWKDKGIVDKSNTDVLIRHMFQVDSHHAFIAMLQIEYGFNAHSNKHIYLHCGEHTKEVKKLQIGQYEIEDFLYRSRYSFSISEELVTRVKLHLENLKSHEKWWVHLYVDSVLKKAPDLKK